MRVELKRDDLIGITAPNVYARDLREGSEGVMGEKSIIQSLSKMFNAQHAHYRVVVMTITKYTHSALNKSNAKKLTSLVRFPAPRLRAPFLLASLPPIACLVADSSESYTMYTLSM